MFSWKVFSSISPSHSVFHGSRHASLISPEQKFSAAKRLWHGSSRGTFFARISLFSSICSDVEGSTSFYNDSTTYCICGVPILRYLERTHYLGKVELPSHYSLRQCKYAFWKTPTYWHSHLQISSSPQVR